MKELETPMRIYWQNFVIYDRVFFLLLTVFYVEIPFPSSIDHGCPRLALTLAHSVLFPSAAPSATLLNFLFSPDLETVGQSCPSPHQRVQCAIPGSALSSALSAAPFLSKRLDQYGPLLPRRFPPLPTSHIKSAFHRPFLLSISLSTCLIPSLLLTHSTPLSRDLQCLHGTRRNVSLRPETRPPLPTRFFQISRRSPHHGGRACCCKVPHPPA